MNNLAIAQNNNTEDLNFSKFCLSTIFLFVVLTAILKIFIVLFSFSLLLDWQYNVDFAIVISSLFSSIYISIYSLKLNKKKSVVYSLCLMLLLLSLLYISTKSIDHSFDGNSYHFDSTYCFYKHMHPLSDECIARLPSKHFPSIGWAFNSVVWGATQNINAANFLSYLALLICIFAGFDIHARLIKGRVSKLIPSHPLVNPVFLSIVLCPIVWGQIGTKANDGISFAVILSFIWSLYNLRQRNAKFISFDLIIGFCSFIIAIGLKYSTGVLVVMYTLFFAVFILLLRNERKIIHQKIQSLCKEQVYLIVAGIALICIAGFHPYATNLLAGKHVFFWVMGEGKQAVDLVGNCVKPFPRILMPFIGAFASPDSYGGPECDIVRFNSLSDVFNPHIIASHYNRSVNSVQGHLIAGFGAAFSILLILASSQFVILALNFLFKKTTNNVSIFAIMVITAGMLQIIITPPSWMARYVPTVWLVPTMLIIIIQNIDKFIVLQKVISYSLAFILIVHGFALAYTSYILNITTSRAHYIYLDLLTDVSVNNVIHNKTVLRPVSQYWFEQNESNLAHNYCVTLNTLHGRVVFLTNVNGISTLINRLYELPGDFWLVSRNFADFSQLLEQKVNDISYAASKSWYLSDIKYKNSEEISVQFSNLENQKPHEIVAKHNSTHIEYVSDEGDFVMMQVYLNQEKNVDNADLPSTYCQA